MFYGEMFKKEKKDCCNEACTIFFKEYPYRYCTRKQRIFPTCSQSRDTINNQ